MERLLVSALVGSGALVVLAFYVLLFMAAIGWPLMVWSIARNVRGIRRELERFNAAHLPPPSAGGGATLGL